MTIHLHSGNSAARWQTGIVLASMPVALIGAWNLGWQITHSAARGAVSLATPGWWLTSFIDAQVDSIVGCTLTGLGFFLPVAAAALLTTALWGQLFASIRNRGPDSSWLMSGWLLALLLPPGVTLFATIAAASFAAVVGAQLFGGTGRYLVSPALLGALFVLVSYPELNHALPYGADTNIKSSWHIASGAVAGASTGSPLDFFLGREAGNFGTGSAAAALIGAAFLVLRQIISWRIVAGGLLAATGTTLLLGGLSPEAEVLSWQWQLSLGQLVFVLAFIATDPGITPHTRGARWLLGALTGAITVALRCLDPTHPEATLFAVLLATLAMPLADHAAVSMQRRRLVAG